MSNNELQELADSIFGDAWDATAVELDASLWATLGRTGLARLTLPEEAGGSQGTFADAAVVLGAAGRFAARVPLVETDLLAGWLTHAAGLEVPDGPLSAVAAPGLRIEGDRATGTLSRVPWARAVTAVAVLGDDRVAIVDPADAQVVEGTNLAEESRDELVLTGALVRSAPLPAGAAAEYRSRAALGRSLLLAGAAHGAVAMAARYATERVQFGRPIAKLQAIQQMLALAAAEAAAAVTAASAAAAEVDAIGFTDGAIAVAAAKSRCGAAAGEVARIAHQVHGAIGVTREYDLRLLTTRLWAWRDEDGSEVEWDDVLGVAALRAGPDQLWSLLTG